MFLGGAAENEDVIKKYQYEFSDESLKDCVHESLKCGRGISDAKQHY